MSNFVTLRALAAAAVFVMLAGCGRSLTPHSPNPASLPGNSSGHAMPNITKPALVTLDGNGDLAYWPISSGGGDTLTALSKPLGITSYGMAANDGVIVMGDYFGQQIVSYSLKTKTETAMKDPYGNPFDVAIGKTGTIYAMNPGNVAVFAPGTSQPIELSCARIDEGEAIAVNKEGDVFVDGYGKNFEGVIEYKAGKSKCTTPDLNPVEGYVGGVGVDPKTDSLITIDDPDDCAGGQGRMFIYPKPYQIRTARRVNLNYNYCSGTFRLNSTSTLIFVSDASIDDSYPIVDQFAYPSGGREATYQIGPGSGSGYFGPFITLPTKLPN